MHGKQLALSFVSPFKSIMQSSQVSCSTNLHHLMARERNGIGKAPESSPRRLFWPSHLCSDSLVMMLLCESLFLNVSFSHLLSASKETYFNIVLLITTFFGGLQNTLDKMPNMLVWQIFKGLKDQTQTSVYSTTALKLHYKPSCSILCQLWYYFSKYVR